VKSFVYNAAGTLKGYH